LVPAALEDDKEEEERLKKLKTRRKKRKRLTIGLLDKLAKETDSALKSTPELVLFLLNQLLDSLRVLLELRESVPLSKHNWSFTHATSTGEKKKREKSLTILFTTTSTREGKKPLGAFIFSWA